MALSQLSCQDNYIDQDFFGYLKDLQSSFDIVNMLFETCWLIEVKRVDKDMIKVVLPKLTKEESCEFS